MATDTLVFVSCADSGELHVLRLASDSGQLRTEQVLALGGQLMPMALSPNGTRLYVARRSDPLAVVTLAVDARAGRAEMLAEAPLPASMAHLATDNTGRWLLSASYGADLVAVQAIAADGVVAAGRGATTYATGRHAHSALVSPGNRFVLAASLGGGQLHRYLFDAATGVGHAHVLAHFIQRLRAPMRRNVGRRRAYAHGLQAQAPRHQARAVG